MKGGLSMWQLLLGRMIEKNTIRINSANCLQARYKDYDCNKCLQDCPRNSIKIENNKVKIDEQSCNNCGICTYSCPTKTFHIENEGLIACEKKMNNKRLANFTCRKQGDDRVDILLPCLKNLSLEMLMVASLEKLPIQINWDRDICTKCEVSFNQEKLVEIINLWNSQSNLENNALILHEKSLNKNHFKKVSRREFFTFSKQTVKGQIGDFIFDSFNEINFRDKVQIQENRNYLKKFINLTSYQDKIIDPKMTQKLSLCIIKAEGDCNLCDKCTKLCPTGALQVKEEPLVKKLFFDPGLCLDCGICLNNCAYLYKSDIKEVTFKELMVKVELHKDHFDNCPKCGELKSEKAPVCLDCEREIIKKTSFEESFLAPPNP